MKSDEQLVKSIYNKHAEEFIEMERKNPTRKFVSNLIMRELGDVKNKKILDAGCGAGTDTIRIAAKARHVVGIDISRKMIDIAKKKNRIDNLSYQITDMKKTDFRNDSFDMITVIFSLMYVKELRKVCCEFKRILKPQGEILIIIPNPMRRMIKFTHNYFRNDRVWFTHRKIRYFNYCHKTEDYINSLSQNGFVIEKISEPKLEIRNFKDNFYPWHLLIKARVAKDK
jgi:ubiquinone/menaquinone biosynthesis C-methylase UbiE